MKKGYVLAILVLIFLAPPGISQEEDRHEFVTLFDLEYVDAFLNPSFEQMTRNSIQYQPDGYRKYGRLELADWLNCGPDGECPPSVQTVDIPKFNIENSVFDGDQCLILVTKKDNLWESISQELSQPLEPGNTYVFGFFASHSDYMVYQEHCSANPQSFATPVVIQIFGGQELCDNQELLYNSGYIDHSFRQEYVVIFEPNIQISWITIEAWYANEDKTYNGNVLLDDFSNIYRVKQE